MDFDKIRETAFTAVQASLGYDLKGNLTKGTLGITVRKFMANINICNTVIGFYENLVKANLDEDTDMAALYNYAVKKFLEGNGKDVKGVKAHLRMFFFIREIEADQTKRKALAEFFIIYFNLIENEVVKPDNTRLSVIKSFDAEYAKYYDSNYLFNVLREAPLEVKTGVI